MTPSFGGPGTGMPLGVPVAPGFARGLNEGQVFASIPISPFCAGQLGVVRRIIDVPGHHWRDPVRFAGTPREFAGTPREFGAHTAAAASGGAPARPPGPATRMMHTAERYAAPLPPPKRDWIKAMLKAIGRHIPDLSRGGTRAVPYLGGIYDRIVAAAGDTPGPAATALAAEVERVGWTYRAAADFWFQLIGTGQLHVDEIASAAAAAPAHPAPPEEAASANRRTRLTVIEAAAAARARGVIIPLPVMEVVLQGRPVDEVMHVLRTGTTGEIETLRDMFPRAGRARRATMTALEPFGGLPAEMSVALGRATPWARAEGAALRTWFTRQRGLWTKTPADTPGDDPVEFLRQTAGPWALRLQALHVAAAVLMERLVDQHSQDELTQDELMTATIAALEACIAHPPSGLIGTLRTHFVQLHQAAVHLLRAGSFLPNLAQTYTALVRPLADPEMPAAYHVFLPIAFGFAETEWEDFLVEFHAHPLREAALILELLADLSPRSRLTGPNAKAIIAERREQLERALGLWESYTRLEMRQLQPRYLFLLAILGSSAVMIRARVAGWCLT